MQVDSYSLPLQILSDSFCPLHRLWSDSVRITSERKIVVVDTIPDVATIKQQFYLSGHSLTILSSGRRSELEF